MAKYIRVIENGNEPKNKQAKELVDFAKKIHGHNKFAQKDFMTLLSDQKGKNTALLNSKADPALTWNYYRPALWFYGSVEMYEDDTKLTPKLGSIDPYNRSSKTKTKSLSLMDELKSLEERIEKDMARVEEINDILAKATAAGVEMKPSDSPQAPEISEEDATSPPEGLEEEPAEEEANA